MKKDPKIFLLHILENINLVLEDLRNIQKDDFFNTKLLQDATIRRIELIGEAVKNLPEEIKATYTNIPWRQIAATRDFIIHEYFSIDVDLIWEVTQKDLPDLKKKIEKILKDLENNEKV